jgi:acetyl esterase/lipase
VSRDLATCEGRVEKNVVFGTYSGLALLMDVHCPARPNGYGIVVIPGSGWTSKQTYDAPLLTALASSVRFFLPKLFEAGYTLFVANHRNGPRFQYPAAVEDVQRAVRFIRYNANLYSINPKRIGAVGYSSGAHLAALLGVLDVQEDSDDPDPVNRVSAQVQCVVAAATPTDFTHFQSAAWALFMGQLVALPGGSPDPIAVKAYRTASPVTHVSSSSAPMLLVHGDADAIVPFQMAEIMREAMEKVGVDVKVIQLPGGSHDFAGETIKRPDWPDFFSESVSWMDRYLKPQVSDSIV